MSKNKKKKKKQHAPILWIKNRGMDYVDSPLYTHDIHHPDNPKISTGRVIITQRPILWQFSIIVFTGYGHLYPDLAFPMAESPGGYETLEEATKVATEILNDCFYAKRVKTKKSKKGKGKKQK